MKRISLLLILLVLCPFSSQAQDDPLYSFATLEAVPIAMAGAVTARLGGMESTWYNPATYTRYRSEFQPDQLHVSVNVNPAAILGYSGDMVLGRDIPGHPVAGPASFVIRGVTVTRTPFIFGAVMGEEEFDQPRNRQFDLFELRDTPNRYRGNSFLVFAVSPRVRVGGTISGYIRENSVHALGASYGVYLEPGDNFNIGVFFSELPDGFSESRRFLSGVEDQTVNAGISYEPNRKTLLTCDVRNVFQEEGDRDLEVRVGAERRLGDLLMLRMGIIPATQVGDQYFTWGLGLLDRHRLTESPHHYRVPHFMVNYAMVQKRSEEQWETVHLLTLSVEIG